MRKILSRKLFVYFTLFVSWLFFTGLYIYSLENITSVQTNLGKEAFSVATEELKEVEYSNIEFNELLEGEKLQGKFTATDNYLGQVLIRFYNFKRINPDKVIFRIKEEDSESWYYQSIYKTDQFQPHLLFPFGFPVISYSEGKTYIFEVESLDGQPEQSIGLSPVSPLGAVLYQYPKKLLLSDPNFLVNFIVKEKIEKVEIRETTFISLGKYLNFIILALFLIYLLLDVLDRKSLRTRKINSSHTIFIGIAVIIISAITLYLRKISLSEQLTILGFFILALGVIHAIIESRKSND